MTFVTGCKNFDSNDYASLISRDVGTYFEMPMHTYIVNNIYSGSSLGKAFRDGYDLALSQINPNDDFNSAKIGYGLYDVYGAPDTTLEDIIGNPKAIIQPNSKEDEKYIIEIPKGKFAVDFVIKNIGKVDVNYSFDKSNEFEIAPISGNILVDSETKINLKVLDKKIDIQSTDNINNNLKPKTGKIYFKSNAGDKELTIKY